MISIINNTLGHNPISFDIPDIISGIYMMWSSLKKNLENAELGPDNWGLPKKYPQKTTCP